MSMIDELKQVPAPCGPAGIPRKPPPAEAQTVDEDHGAENAPEPESDEA